MARIKKVRQARRAAALVEATLVMPLLCLLVFGVIEYGWMFMKAQQVTNAARAGARTAIRVDATRTQAENSIDALLNAAQITNRTRSISPDPSAASTGQTITATVTAPYSGHLELFGMPLLPVPANLSASVSMAKEGP